MLNRREQIQKIQRHLSLENGSADAFVLNDLFDTWYSAALAKSNRPDGDENPALLAIVRDTVAAAYNMRGNEGMQSFSAGGQSYSYVNLSETLTKRILESNLRIYRI